MSIEEQVVSIAEQKELRTWDKMSSLVKDVGVNEDTLYNRLY